MALHETFPNDFADIPYAIAFFDFFGFCRSLSGLAMVLQSLDVGIAYAVRATKPHFLSLQ
jgi:multidrug transporter EmrE-like cation transporter